jgi:predicted transcriptional regulator of viral defense system
MIATKGFTPGNDEYASIALDLHLWTKALSEKVALARYADRLANGAVFKRLGFLAETDPRGTALVAPCRERLTKGNAKLDPALPGPRLISRWRLFVPAQWAKRGPR